MKRAILDLFCGAGGCSHGYVQAGFEVVGIDKAKQKNYPYRFIQADALKFADMVNLSCFSAIHASPPCQLHSSLAHLPSFKPGNYEDLIEPTRDLLARIGKPYIMENVPGAPLHNPLMLCGSMFGLQTDCGAELRRHRLFEVPWFWDWFYETQDWFGGLPKCSHYANRPIGVYGEGSPMEGRRYIGVKGGHAEAGARTSRVISVYGDHPRDTALEKRKYCKRATVTVTGHSPNNWTAIGERRRRTVSVTGATPQQNVVKNTIRETFTVDAARIAMGIDWMTMKELSQAIPPKYTYWIGLQLMKYLEETA